MSENLADYHRRISAGIAEVREQCARSAPDIVQLTAVRLRLSKASSARSQYVQMVLLPRARERANAKERKELDEMQHWFTAKRLQSSEHVATWTSRTIANNWDGYRAAAQTIWAAMSDQMARERRLLSGLD